MPAARRAATALVALLACPALLRAQVEPREPAEEPRQALEVNPVAPVTRVFEVVYARRLGARTELLLGGAYANVAYEHGQSHAPTLIAGVRRSLWRALHLDYQLWPAYDAYRDTDEHRTWRSGELWNALRPGWTVNFRLGAQPLFVDAEYVVGWALLDGHKPASFREQRRHERVEHAPTLVIGRRF